MQLPPNQSGENKTAEKSTAKKKVFRRDRRPRGGSVTPTQAGLLVRFPYSPSRFEAIKKISGCRYLSDKKAWLVPLSQANYLSDSPLFHESTITYQTASDEVKESIAANLRESELALNRILKDPFSAAESDIQGAALDFAVRLEGGLVIECKQFEKRKQLLGAFPNLIQLKPAARLCCPVEQLPEVLSWARSKLLVFAVEKKTSAALRQGKEERRLLVNGQYPVPVTASKLRALYFAPVAEKQIEESCREEVASRVVIHAPFAEQLALLFPRVESRLQRVKLASGLSLNDFADCLFAAEQSTMTIWRDAALEEAFAQWLRTEELSQHSSEGFLYCVQWPIWFGVSADGSPILVVAKVSLGDALEKLLAAAKALGAVEVKSLKTARLLRVPMRCLIAVYHLFDDIPSAFEIRDTRLFRSIFTEALQRAELNRRREWYHVSQDSFIRINNQGLWSKLFPHQRLAVQWLIEKPASVIADDMGLGKTLSVLTAFDELRYQELVDVLVVICPHSLLKNWEREVAAWLPARSMLIVTSQSKEKRIAELQELISGARPLPDVLAINYEAARLEYVAPLLRDLIGINKTMLCLDESQRVKNVESITFDEIKGMSHVAIRRVLLSGTPAPRDVSDLWAQIYLVDHGQRFGTSYRKWLRTVAEIGSKWGVEAVVKWYPDQVEEVISRVREVMLRRRKEDVVSLPEKIFSVHDVQLEGDQAERYERMRQELLVKVSSLNGKSFSKQVTDVMEEYLRAVQLASNPRLVDQNWEGDPAKFLALDQIVEQVVINQDEKIVIWSNYRRNIEELAERYKDLGVGIYYGGLDKHAKDATLIEFQKIGSTMKVLVATPAAGGVGITLTAAQTAVYIEKTWNAEHYLQSIDRIHRIGQRGTVSIIALQACPIDIMIARNLERKAALLRKIMDEGALPEEVAYWREELLSALEPVVSLGSSSS